MVIGELRTNVF